MSWGDFNDYSNVKFAQLDLLEEKRHIAKAEILAAMYNTSAKYKGGLTYKDFMPESYEQHASSEQLPNSSPDIVRDIVARHNKNFPKNPISFDYDKFKTVN